MKSPEWSLTHFACESLEDYLAWTPTEAGDFSPVEVPGAVQVSSFGLPYSEILLRQNWEQVAWMEDRLWVYRAELSGEQIAENRLAVLRFRGLDYRCRILVNGVEVIDHEGMYSPVEIEFDHEAAAEKNVIHLAFFPPALLPKTGSTALSESVNATDAPSGIPHLKARFMEGWDFTPRLRCVGIWDQVEYFSAAPVRIQNVSVQTRLDNRARAEVAVTVHLNRQLNRGTFRAELNGQTLDVPLNHRTCATIVLQITDPVLWFPHTHGDPTLQRLSLSLSDALGETLDETTRDIGLRDVKRIPAQNQPTTDTPMQFVINGKPVFLNGANLTPFSAIPGTLNEADYRRVLEPLLRANVNFLRVWGGGVREKEAFYRLCDEMGFLVMQEFPLACQRISHDPDYLRLLEQEARAIVRTLGAHPSIIWWTGGNEHYHYWESLDSGSERMEAIKEKMRNVFEIAPEDRTWRGGENSNHPALRLLHGIVQEELPSLPYTLTSGLEDQGDTHGPWNLRLEIGDHRFRDLDFFNFWKESNSHLFSEASVAAAANPQTFARILEQDFERIEIPQDRDEPTWIAHKAFRAAWDKHDDLWLDIPETEKWFGPLTSLKEVVFANHYLQCEATRFMIESVRQRQGHTTGIVWWGINEPFPSLAGNALVGFWGDSKPALELMGSAFSPRLLSLSYSRCVLRTLKGDLYFTNSLPTEFQGRYEVTVVEEISGTELDRYEGSLETSGYSSSRIRPLIPVPLSPGKPVIVRLSLFTTDKKSIHTQVYRFFAQTDSAPLRTLLERSEMNPASLF